jgi:hypothetical protein
VSKYLVLLEQEMNEQYQVLFFLLEQEMKVQEQFSPTAKTGMIEQDPVYYHVYMSNGK